MFCVSARTVAENFRRGAHGARAARRGTCIRVWRVQGMLDAIIPALKHRITLELRSEACVLHSFFVIFLPCCTESIIMGYPNGGKFKKKEKQEKRYTFAFCVSTRTVKENFGRGAHGARAAHRDTCIRVWRVQGMSDAIIRALNHRIPLELRS